MATSVAHADSTRMDAVKSQSAKRVNRDFTFSSLFVEEMKCHWHENEKKGTNA